MYKFTQTHTSFIRKIWGVSFFLMAVLLMGACQGDDILTKNTAPVVKREVAFNKNPKLLSEAQINKIGVLHNRGLAYVLNSLNKNKDKISRFKSSKEMETFLDNQLGDYYRVIVNEDNTLTDKNKSIVLNKMIEMSDKTIHEHFERKKRDELYVEPYSNVSYSNPSGVRYLVAPKMSYLKANNFLFNNDIAEENYFDYDNPSSDNHSPIEEFVLRNKNGKNGKKLNKIQQELLLKIDKLFAEYDSKHDINKKLKEIDISPEYDPAFEYQEKPKLDLSGILNLQTRLQNIAYEAIEKLSPEDAQVILIAVETAKKSSEYWQKHIGEWREFNKYEEDLKRPEEHINIGWTWHGLWEGLKDIAGADVKGAVAGAGSAAAGTFAVNMIPAYGQAAYGSAVTFGAVAGGVGNSILEGLK